MPAANEPGPSERLSWRSSWLPLAAVAGALLAGLYARFKGLGTWPFGVDEFYISRSIDNVLRFGLPEFECGGFYTRGLLYQYLVAGLRSAALAPELASRLVAAVASLAVLPAGYLLGRRLCNRTVGLLVLVVLSISVWEVEMARFARMYAPFQAVFVWYALFFVQYTLERKRSALVAMVLLSVVGILTWEGGALIGLANLLPPFLRHDRGRLRRGDWLYLGGMLLLFLALYLATSDLRGAAEPVVDPDTLGYSAGDAAEIAAPWQTLTSYWGAALVALLPLGLAAASLPWLWGLRRRWLAAAGLALALATVLAQQLFAGFAVLVLLLLTGLVEWREFLSRRGRWYLAACGAGAVFWLAFAVLTGDWYRGATGGLLAPDRILALLQQLAGFPNVLEEIAKPWGQAVPILAAMLFAGLAGLSIRTFVGRERPPTAISVLLVLVLTLVLVIGVSGPPRHETRYAFFLYPIMLTLALVAVEFAVRKLLPHARYAATVTVVAALASFAVTEDFKPRHLATIDSPESNFRIGLAPAVASHYYPRDNIRAVADWLAGRVGAGDIVVSGVPHLSQYFPGVDYFFLDAADPRYSAYACDGGATERWNNLPLLFRTDALAGIVATGARIFVVVYADRQERLLGEADARGWPARVVELSAPGTRSLLILNP